MNFSQLVCFLSSGQLDITKNVVITWYWGLKRHHCLEKLRWTCFQDWHLCIFGEFILLQMLLVCWVTVTLFEEKHNCTLPAGVSDPRTHNEPRSGLLLKPCDFFGQKQSWWWSGTLVYQQQFDSRSSSTVQILMSLRSAFMCAIRLHSSV